MGVANKRVVMTGATNGIGLAAAEELAMLGARLTIIARDQAKAKALANRTGADVVMADLASKNAVHHAADEILARYDRIDVLVNNAGKPKQGAETPVWLVDSPIVEAVTGSYFVDKKRVEPAPAACDLDSARRLWDVSVEQT